MFRFQAQTDMLAQNGQFRTIGAFLREKGFRKPTFLVDEGFSRGPLWAEVEEGLRADFGSAFSFKVSSGAAEPTYDSLRAVLRDFRGSDADVLVGVGGGSCMDTAKAVSALMTNPGDPLEYRGFDRLLNPGIPTVLVPTTAGTGSEASYNASFVDTDTHRKMGINGRYMFATHAILDGEVTLSCPYLPALSAGVDAVVHTLEGFVCRQRNPMSDMLARKAFALLFGALPSLKADPQNAERRLELLLGAFLGGIIQMNSGSGVAAAISYPLSTYYKVPHGIGGGMFCLDVIKFNIDAGFHLYADLAPLIGEGSATSSSNENAMAVHSRLQAMWDVLGVPKTLSAFGIGPERRDHVLEIMKTQQAAFDQNPIPFSCEKDLPRLLEPYL